jgi:hypothetical protein
MDKKVSPGQITVMAAGFVVLVGSFLAFYSYDAPSVHIGGQTIGGGSHSVSAWGSGLFPVATLIVIFGVLMAAIVAVTAFAKVDLPEHVAGFTMDQILLVLGAFSALLALAYLLVDKGGASYGIGYWLTLLGSLGLLAGAVLTEREHAGATHRGVDPGPTAGGGMVPPPV